MPEEKEVQETPEEQADLEDGSEEEAEPEVPGTPKEQVPDSWRKELERTRKQAAAYRIQAKKEKEQREAIIKEQELSKKSEIERANQRIAEAEAKVAELAKKERATRVDALIMAKASSQFAI